MRDNELYEESVNPDGGKTFSILKIAYKIIFWFNIVVGVVFTVMSFMLGIEISTLIFGVLAFAIAFLISFAEGKFYYAVDYTFVSGSLRLVKVIKLKKRKLIAKMEHNEIFKVGRVDSDEYNGLVNKPNVKKIYATPNKNKDNLSYLLAKVNGQDTILILECTDKLLSYIVSYTGRNVLERDFK